MNPERKTIPRWLSHLRVLVASGMLLLGAAAFGRATRAPEYVDRPLATHRHGARQVVLISVDGLAPYVLKRAKAPTIRRLAREGRSLQAHTVRPSLTLPAHFSMLSGLEPSEHHVLWNEYEPFKSPGVRTVFTYCHEALLRCALFAGKDKFAHFAEHELGVSRYELHADSASIFQAARRYFESSQPDLMVIHLPEVDTVGHQWGWNTPEQLRAIEEVDRAMSPFPGVLDRAAVREHTVILTADHGGQGQVHDRERETDMRVPWIIWGSGVRELRGSLPPISLLDTARTAVSLLAGRPSATLPGRDLTLALHGAPAETAAAPVQ